MFKRAYSYLKKKWKKHANAEKFFAFVGKFFIYSIFLYLMIYVSVDAVFEDRGVGTSALDESGEYSDTNETFKTEDKDCNVQGIVVQGFLSTYGLGSSIFDEEVVTTSQDVEYYIEQANLDESIKAILVEIDSPGGLPVAGEEIASAIDHVDKPIVALIRQSGASAAYWAASSADYIFASKNSDVGGIGVTMSYLENSGNNESEGIKFVELNSAKFKDAGSPEKSLTEEERELFMRDLQLIHDNFVGAIAKNRNLSVEEVSKLADGSTVLGESALDYRLIDQIGGIYEVKDYLAEKIGEEVRLCW